MNNPNNDKTAVTTPAEEGRPIAVDLRQQAFEYLKHVAGVHKARMTWHLAMASGTVILTGYGFQNRTSALFFLAAAVPIFQLLTDYTLKRFVTCPLAYKALLCDIACGDEEPLALLFLDFRQVRQSAYARIAALTDTHERRLHFRRRYIRRGFLVKGILSER